jgi:DNA-binding CsgD family transcriptional regulator/GAF domain-containing protein
VPEIHSLSPREIEIAGLYAGGATYQRIATGLGIAPTTVRTHLATIYRKLEVSSKVQLRALLDGTTAPAAVETDTAAVISELALSLEEAISRERALGEVLKIISRSGGDINTVMPAILSYALDLCEAQYGALFECEGEGVFRATFMLGLPVPFQNWFDEQGAFPVGPNTGLGRMRASHESVSIADVRAENTYQSGDPLRRATVDLGGARSFVAIPMMAGDRLVGAFSIYRQQVRPFAPEALALAQVFADQSAIALENARMISALREGSREKA